jgi:ribose/xylose/arabinose/galactoside ABC-type transport system permease subunit
MMEIILIVLCLVLALSAPNFLTLANLLNVLRTISMQGIIAFGMTMVIVSGEIDLSVGSAAGFAGCLIAYLTKVGIPIPIGVMMTLAVGFGIGSFTGVMRTKYQVPSFITTLALLTGLRGGALLITKGFTLTPFPDWFKFLGGGYLFRMPFPALVLIVAFIGIHFVMTYTSFGRSVYAVGGNAETARLCGMDVTLVRILVLAITGTLCSLSGIMLASRINSGSPSAGQGWELEVISAVIIGGTSLAGGVGTVWGTLIGVVFIGVITNGMTLLNVPIYGQLVVKGLLILVAVLINRMQQTSH